MLSIYPACFFKEDSEKYSVIFPDLNWLSTCGNTLNEAMSMAVDCLAGYLYNCQKDGESLPEASSIKNINLENIAKELELHFEDAFINMVSVDVSAYAKDHFEHSVKKTLTIPAWLNKAALEKGINFSQVLQEALISKIKA